MYRTRDVPVPWAKAFHAVVFLDQKWLEREHEGTYHTLNSLLLPSPTCVSVFDSNTYRFRSDL